MAELSGSELLREWQKLMDSLTAAASSVAGHSDLPRRLVEPMQRQLELLTEVIERERRLQRELVTHLVAPVDAVFDLLEESGATLHRQAEALEAAGSALEETARLMKHQAELFERTIGTLRQPAELAKAAASSSSVPRASGAAARPAPAGPAADAPPSSTSRLRVTQPNGWIQPMPCPPRPLLSFEPSRGNRKGPSMIHLANFSIRKPKLALAIWLAPLRVCSWPSAWESATGCRRR